MHETLDDQAKETVVAYALGLLNPEERAGFEQHVEAGCGACASELNSMNNVSDWISLAAPLAMPPARLRDKILQIPRLAASEPAARIVRSADGAWKPFCPNVVAKHLDFNPALRTRTMLLKMEPGSFIPPHHHSGPEQCYVLEGEVIVEGSAYHPGDYVREPAGSDHALVSTHTGCLLLIISSEGVPAQA